MVSNMAVARKIQGKHEDDSERYYSQKDRAKMDPDDFAGPSRSFPILTQADVHNAARLIGHADDPGAVKRKIIAIAKRKGFNLPDAWKSEDDDKKPKESASPGAKKLATITTCFLEDDAISLNGRQYPREAVDRLIASAQARLANPDALPLTCYISHDKADKDESRDLVGKITNVWREGIKAYAAIDIPDTAAGRDMATLVDGGYMRTQSLRASGAQMKVVRGRSLPQVGGTDLELEGIDFTSMPGLSQVARITNMVLAESAEPAMITEVFHASELLCEEQHMEEEYISPLATGASRSMDGSPGSDYPYQAAPMLAADGGIEMPKSPQTDEAHRAVHDHLANVLDACLTPMHGNSREAARIAAGLSLEEAGRKLAMAHARHLAAAHDLAAHEAKMDCEGAYEAHLGKMAQPDNAAGNDGMQDGDDDDREKQTLSRSEVEAMVREALRSTQPMQPATKPVVKETKRPMTQEEAARLLAAAGYKVEPPKTREQLMQEQIDAKLAEQRKQMEEQQAALLAQMEEVKKQLATAANPFAKAQAQRTSLVEGATAETTKRPYYRNGDYMREQLRDITFREQLLDRSRPLPDNINPEHLLKELQWELLGMYDATYGLVGNPKIIAI